MRVEFGALTVTDRARKLINGAIDSNRLSSGKYVRELEEQFADFVGTKEAVAVSSGTDALTLSLAALDAMEIDICRGCGVVVPALSFAATGNAIMHAGFQPVFVDVNINTLSMNIEEARKIICKGVPVVLPVHLMGKPVDMDELSTLSATIVEDAAEAHGAKYKNKNIGTFGLMAAFSLYVAHIISSIEGGMITTNNPEAARILRSLRNHGRLCDCKVYVLNTNPKECPRRFKKGFDGRFVFDKIGYSCKMNELEAAVGLGTMEIAEEILEKRKENFYYFSKEFERFEDYFYTIKEESHELIGPHAFSLILKEGLKFKREDLTSYLIENGIDNRTLFSSIPTQNEGFKHFGYQLGEFPVAEYIGENGLHFGIHQDIGKKERKYIMKTFERFIRKHK